METAFLCWNLNRRPLQQLVAQLARARKVDVLILLECAYICRIRLLVVVSFVCARPLMTPLQENDRCLVTG
jgi:hypothetical protein